MEEDEISMEASATLNVNFETPREAEIVQKTLEVDSEPSRSKSKKDFSTSGKVLTIKVNCPDVRELRLTLNSVMDHLHLVTQTLNKFGPAQPPSKKTCLHNED